MPHPASRNFKLSAVERKPKLKEDWDARGARFGFPLWRLPDRQAFASSSLGRSPGFSSWQKVFGGGSRTRFQTSGLR
jgi:hypothetical protein